MFFKRFGDFVVGIFFLIVAIAIYVMARALPASLMGGLGSDFMPKVLAVVTGVLAVLQIISGIQKMRTFVPEDQSEEDKPEYLRVLVTIVAFTLYVALMESVGFILTSIVYLFVQMCILATKEQRNYLMFAVIAIVFNVVVYFVFRNGLNVMLPAGILG